MQRVHVSIYSEMHKDVFRNRKNRKIMKSNRSGDKSLKCGGKALDDTFGLKAILRVNLMKFA
jgi:hypothetical protein